MAIRLLDQSLVAQIAAGEVIERPASAVKELVENSIDGEAGRIDVDVTRGGLGEIRIRDDGIGITADELQLAVQPHATSKLASASQLKEILTLGFRGEALASVASLANLTVRSRDSEADEGAELKLEGAWSGEEAHPHLMSPGTEVIVQDLFIHAPARRRFISREKLEYSHCESRWRSLAISHPEIAFTFSHAGVVRHDLPKQSAQERVFAVMGKAFSENAVPVNYNKGPLRLEGWVRPNGAADSHRQLVILNGRVLSDRLLRQAIRKACSDVMRKDNIPYAVFMDIPIDLVDVNAHPAKLEVRFRERQAIFKFVFDAFRRAVVNPLALGQEQAILLGDAPAAGGGRAQRMEVPGPGLGLAASPRLRGAEDAPGRGGEPAGEWSAGAELSAAAYSGIGERSGEGSGGTAPSDGEEGRMPEELGDAIGLLHGIYVIAQNSSGLVLVDLHAAHERLIYEDLKRAHDAKAMPSQQLLVPIELELSAEQIDALIDERGHLGACGFAIEEDGGAHYLKAVPSSLAERIREPDKLVLEYLSEIAKQGAGASVEEERNRILADVACRSAVRGSQPSMSLGDLNDLLRRMERTPSAGVCNHGRPTWKVVRIDDLDRQFERGR